MPQPRSAGSPADACSTVAPVTIRRGINVGVLAPLTGGVFWGEIIAGIVHAVDEAGGLVTLVQTLDAGQTGASYQPIVGKAEPLGWEHIDGFVATLRATDDAFLRRARAAGKPVVVVSDHTRDVDAASVTVDNVSGIHAAVAHLVEHGHTRIGFLGHDGHSDIRERYDAYRAAMTGSGLEPHELIVASDDVVGGGLGAAASVAAAFPAWTAIIAGTDRNAHGLITGLRDAGLVVPRDIAVIGFDDVESSWLSDPPLTTSRQRFDALGVVAAEILLAEVSGNPPEHWRHTVPTTLVLRASCGCDPARTSAAHDLAATTDAMVTAITDIVGVDLGGPTRPGRRLEELDPGALDAVITSSVESLLTMTRGLEGFHTFLHMSVRRLTDAAAEAKRVGVDGWDSLEYAAAQVASTLVQLESAHSLARITGLSLAYDEQFDIGMGLLGHGDDDPADLRWMAQAGVRVGCLGLWDGAPDEGRLVIAGVHGADGRLQQYLGSRCTVQEFPPREVFDLVDSSADQVTYLVPVRGASGDHGVLCVVGTAEREFAITRSGYDHWAALLGESLREKRLLEDIRHSEERYAFAARAANDGLWELNTSTGEIYLSGRCRELIGVLGDEAVTPQSLTDRFHPDDLPMVVAGLAKATDDVDVPVEVECRLRPARGAAPWVLIRALGVARDGDGRGLVGSISDIDRRKALEEQLRSAALVDELTGLPNRRFFLDRLRQEIGRRERRSSSWFAVLFLDLDGFKLINDSLGHLAGDELLRVVGDRVRTGLRPMDTAARFGGDEFAVLLADPMPEDLLVVALRIQERIAAPVTLGDQEVRVTASIGIATADTGYTDPEDVLRDADTAMYRAKEVEHGGTCVFDPTMHQSALDRLHLRTEVAAGLKNHEFVVHYQPIVDLVDATVTHFEALVRWQHPTRGLLGPAEFLPAMDGNGTIVTLDRQVLDDVCAQIARWRQETCHPVRVSVNVAHRDFWSPDFLATVEATLSAHGVPPRCVSLELTENIIMTDPDQARATMAGLRAFGVGLHIDDFGTGHSSLHLLRTFPLDTLKIDGSFVRELTVIDESSALVRAIVTMATALGMSTIAECVETPEQATRLRELGCTTGQGWLYARAMSADDATQVLGTRLQQTPVPGR